MENAPGLRWRGPRSVTRVTPTWKSVGRAEAAVEAV